MWSEKNFKYVVLSDSRVFKIRMFAKETHYIDNLLTNEMFDTFVLHFDLFRRCEPLSKSKAVENAMLFIDNGPFIEFTKT